MSPADRFLARCSFRDDGLLSARPDDRWRVGILAFVTCADDVLLVRKAQAGPEAYAFRAMWAMPGGVVRQQSGLSSGEDAASASLAGRLSAEAGVNAFEARNGGYAAALGPIMTSYARHDRVWHTLVLVRKLAMTERASLSAADPSVDEACWRRIPPDWHAIAPANRLALSHLLWNQLSDQQRDIARPGLEEALASCNRWAGEMDVTLAVPPWAGADALGEWLDSFS